MSVLNTTVGILGFLLITLLILLGQLFFASLGGVLFSIKYSSYPLIPLAITIDAYFGAFYTFPLLSVMVVLWSVCIEVFRPRLFVVQS